MNAEHQRHSRQGAEEQDWPEEVRRRAEELRQEAGAPEDQIHRYLKRAEELLAIERNQEETLKPNPMHSREQPGDAEPVEPPEALENQGEFPGLADQGDESPQPPHWPEEGEEQDRQH